MDAVLAVAHLVILALNIGTLVASALILTRVNQLVARLADRDAPKEALP